jgi:hypothetical protein
MQAKYIIGHFERFLRGQKVRSGQLGDLKSLGP